MKMTKALETISEKRTPGWVKWAASYKSLESIHKTEAYKRAHEDLEGCTKGIAKCYAHSRCECLALMANINPFVAEMFTTAYKERLTETELAFYTATYFYLKHDGAFYEMVKDWEFGNPSLVTIDLETEIRDRGMLAGRMAKHEATEWEKPVPGVLKRIEIATVATSNALRVICLNLRS